MKNADVFQKIAEVVRLKEAGLVSGGLLGWLPLAGSLCIAIGYAVPLAEACIEIRILRAARGRRPCRSLHENEV